MGRAGSAKSATKQGLCDLFLVQLSVTPMASTPVLPIPVSVSPFRLKKKILCLPEVLGGSVALDEIKFPALSAKRHGPTATSTVIVAKSANKQKEPGLRGKKRRD